MNQGGRTDGGAGARRGRAGDRDIRRRAGVRDRAGPASQYLQSPLCLVLCSAVGPGTGSGPPDKVRDAKRLEDTHSERPSEREGQRYQEGNEGNTQRVSGPTHSSPSSVPLHNMLPLFDTLGRHTSVLHIFTHLLTRHHQPRDLVIGDTAPDTPKTPSWTQ